MQAFETVGTIDTKGHLKLAEPLQFRNKYSESYYFNC